MSGVERELVFFEIGLLELAVFAACHVHNAHGKQSQYAHSAQYPAYIFTVGRLALTLHFGKFPREFLGNQHFFGFISLQFFIIFLSHVQVLKARICLSRRFEQLIQSICNIVYQPVILCLNTQVHGLSVKLLRLRWLIFFHIYIPQALKRHCLPGGIIADDEFFPCLRIPLQCLLEISLLQQHIRVIDTQHTYPKITPL